MRRHSLSVAVKWLSLVALSLLLRNVAGDAPHALQRRSGERSALADFGKLLPPECDALDHDADGER